MVSKAKAPLEFGAHWGVGILYIGSRIGGLGNSEVVLGGAGGGRGAGGAAEATPLEICKESPSEVAAEALLGLEEVWERMGGVLAGRKVASSSGIGREVG